MRVLLIHNRYRSGSPGGEDVVVEQERQLLEEAGHEVTLYQRSNDEVSLRSPSQVASLVFGMKRSQRTIRDLARLIADRKPDVAHIHNLFPLISSTAYEACMSAGIPVVQTLHNYRLSCVAANHFRDDSVCTRCTPHDHGAGVSAGCYRGSRLASLMVGRAVESMWTQAVDSGAVARFIVLSNFARNWLQTRGVDQSRIVIKPNFIQPLVPAAREPLRCSDSGYFVFSGRLSEEKGVGVLIEAWKSLRDYALLVIGDGPSRRSLEAEVARYELPIRFTGHLPRDQAMKVMATARGVIVPSIWFEGMPMVVLEAWAVGVPVIASRIGGLQEMLAGDSCGLGFTPGDPQALQVAVKQLIQAPELAAQRIERALDVVRQRHSSEYSLRALEGVYRDVATRRMS